MSEKWPIEASANDESGGDSVAAQRKNRSTSHMDTLRGSLAAGRSRRRLRQHCAITTVDNPATIDHPTRYFHNVMVHYSDGQSAMGIGALNVASA
jgi:hypothetical protein